MDSHPVPRPGAGFARVIIDKARVAITRMRRLGWFLVVVDELCARFFFSSQLT